MYDEDRQALHKWFKEHKGYGTYHNYAPMHPENDEYVIDQSDIDEFCDFLRENVADLVGIPCMVGNGGIWFTRKDLEKARFY